jgi:hypothetical protein
MKKVYFVEGECAADEPIIIFENYSDARMFAEKTWADEKKQLKSIIGVPMVPDTSDHLSKTYIAGGEDD